VGLALRSTRPKPWYDGGDVRLRGLLSVLRGDPRVLAFAEAELGALLAHDAAHGSDLTGTLRAYFRAGGNKTLLAGATHLSRPALYARLATIERVLGVRLDDPESAVSLHVALLVREMAGAGPAG
jgi:purine catabolism regulator